MNLRDNAQNFQDALSRIDGIVEESENDQDAEKRAALAEGYASALRYNNLIEHAQFKELTAARQKALQGWYWSDKRKVIVQAAEGEQDGS